MTSKVAIANSPDSDHDLRVNVRQAGAQTEWIVPPGKQTVIVLDGNPDNMDIRIAEGELSRRALTGAKVGLIENDRVIDIEPTVVPCEPKRISHYDF